MTVKELEFAVFCIESIAEDLGLKGDEAYKLLAEKSDILDNYIVQLCSRTKYRLSV
jgi:hypothetical protein